jgi:A/G-specific adenine glycosylase
MDNRKISFFQKELLAWYKENGRKLAWRKPRCTSYVQVLAEFLLQRTPADRVDRALSSMTQAFKTWQAIADASDAELEVHLKPLGLWRRRVSALRKFAAEIRRRDGIFPVTRGELESIPAVGQYIANAIMLLVHSDPQPLLDVNMARVLERYFGPRKLVDIRYDPYLQQLSREVLKGVDAKALNWAILDFASAYCRSSSPLCTKCALKRRCLYYKQHRNPNALPFRVGIRPARTGNERRANKS